MINITLRQLRYFVALAKHRHFGRAAEDCSVSQPALSVQIKELEILLGSPVFERLARDVRLTPLGQNLLTRAKKILHSVEELSDLSRAAQGRHLGHFSIGIIPTIAPYLVPGLIKKLDCEFENTELHIRETTTQNLLNELVEGRIDAAILALPISEPSMHSVALFEESFLLVRPKADAELPVPSRDQLHNMKLFLLEEGHCFRDQALSYCNISPTSARKTLEGTSLATLVQMVGAGLGVTLIPEMAAPVETRSAQVSIARFEAPEPTRTIGMVWRKTSPMAQQYAQVAQIISKLAKAF